MKLVVVSAGLSTPSSTRLLADRLTAATLTAATLTAATPTAATLAPAGPAHPDLDVHVVEVRELATDIAQHFTTGFPPARLAAALDAVAAADALIAVTPVFAGSYSGLFKSFFDLLDKDALTGTPMLLGATGGTARHSLVTEHALRPLFSYLRALVLPTAVYAASEDWGGEGLAGRITRAGTELARFLTPAPHPAAPASASASAPDVDTTAAVAAPRSPTGAITSLPSTAAATLTPFAERLAALGVQ
ncbi:FMN reductase [Streptomyces sp. Ag109_G2-6]|uniref:CE1759 family FMN reductase n=1 Tax=Streptomyces TaxID=1883 RepID=UPI0009A49A98|nr:MULTISPECIES: CE1759 family FMN reductase [Streptomyces]RPF25547.1 FMN reductase [Streptomyces sp. Ag109_G2-6]